jgi:hypothetical protein
MSQTLTRKSENPFIIKRVFSFPGPSSFPLSFPAMLLFGVPNKAQVLAGYLGLFIHALS